jgi:hypothetical protein
MAFFLSSLSWPDLRAGQHNHGMTGSGIFERLCHPGCLIQILHCAHNIETINPSSPTKHHQNACKMKKKHSLMKISNVFVQIKVNDFEGAIIVLALISLVINSLINNVSTRGGTRDRQGEG